MFRKAIRFANLVANEISQIQITLLMAKGTFFAAREKNYPGRRLELSQQRWVHRNWRVRLLQLGGFWDERRDKGFISVEPGGQGN